MLHIGRWRTLYLSCVLFSFRWCKILVCTFLVPYVTYWHAGCSYVTHWHPTLKKFFCLPHLLHMLYIVTHMTHWHTLLHCYMLHILACWLFICYTLASHLSFVSLWLLWLYTETDDPCPQPDKWTQHCTFMNAIPVHIHICISLSSCHCIVVLWLYTQMNELCHCHYCFIAIVSLCHWCVLWLY